MPASLQETTSCLKQVQTFAIEHWDCGWLNIHLLSLFSFWKPVKMINISSGCNRNFHMCHSNIILVNNTSTVFFSIWGAAFTPQGWCGQCGSRVLRELCFFPLSRKKNSSLKCSIGGKIKVARKSTIKSTWVKLKMIAQSVCSDTQSFLLAFLYILLMPVWVVSGPLPKMKHSVKQSFKCGTKDFIYIISSYLQHICADLKY